MKNTKNTFLSEPELIKYSQWLKSRHLSSNTIQIYLATIKQFPQFNNSIIQDYFQKQIARTEPATLFLKKYALNSYAKFKRLKIHWQQVAKIPTIAKNFLARLMNQN